MRASEHHDSSYQVVVAGELMPAVLAFCLRHPVQDVTCGVFHVRVRDDPGIADIAARVQAANLMILSIRRMTEPEEWPVVVPLEAETAVRGRPRFARPVKPMAVSFGAHPVRVMT